MTEKRSIRQRLTGAAKTAFATVKSSLQFDLFARFKAPEVEIDFPVDMEGDTVWATQKQIAELFAIDRSVVAKHIAKIFESGEIERDEATCAKFAQVRFEGGREVSREIEHYSLDVILAVGFRTSSARAIAFRKWASQVLKGYIQDGYALNGARLSNDPSALLKLAQDVRALRTSEKNLYAQVREVFAMCAIDYNPSSEEARKFFAQCQDICHYAASQRTATEIIVERADAKKPNMGLTALGNMRPTAADVTVAKNYCSAGELRKMELIAESFLLYAESMAAQEKQVSMARLLERFVALVSFYEYPVFEGYGPGRPTRKQADSYARKQYELFKRNGPTALPTR